MIKLNILQSENINFNHNKATITKDKKNRARYERQEKKHLHMKNDVEYKFL